MWRLPPKSTQAKILFPYTALFRSISFVIERNEKKIFHAGDLNNWHWDEESTEAEIRAAESAFTRKLRKIASEYPEFDLAMFPVDPRLGHNYMKGAMQFVEAIKVKTFAPMHFGIDYKSANKFEDFAKSHGCNFMKITEQGVSINF